MLEIGGAVAIVGMSVVFAFLFVMVGLLKISAGVLGKFFPEDGCDVPSKEGFSEIVAAIAAARSHQESSATGEG